MKISPANMTRALTLIDLLVIVAIIAILAAMLDMGPSSRSKSRAQRISCVYSLKQIGLAFHAWGDDHNGMFPMRVSTNAGGTMEFITGPNAFVHFRIMSNELISPKILFCPAELDSTRLRATTFSPADSVRDKWQVPFAGNSNITYFVGVAAVKTNGGMFLAGDRNLTNGTSIKSGLLTLTTNQLAGWTEKIHGKQGNILFADASVQQLSTSGLRTALEKIGMETNRLAMP